MRCNLSRRITEHLLQMSIMICAVRQVVFERVIEDGPLWWVRAAVRRLSVQGPGGSTVAGPSQRGCRPRGGETLISCVSESGLKLEARRPVACRCSPTLEEDYK
jgi:hypothetical protein